jgi:uncharacterized protein YjeT (DUF2065 family)
MWKELAIAFALVLVIEGIVPFLYPRRWRSLAMALAEVPDGTMRIVGLMSMLIGTALLYVIR